MANLQSQIPIIVLAFSNDDGRSLRQLDMEQKELRKIFQKAEDEKKCKLLVLVAATASDIIQIFQEYRTQIKIFHYGGHSSEDSIFFKNQYSEIQGITSSSFAGFLALQKGLELVFLNSCQSLPQAKKYHAFGVKTVIATDQEVGDLAAREFSKLFYDSLVKGSDIKQAYEYATSVYQLKYEDTFRGLISRYKEKGDRLPWQLFPNNPLSWRLPQVAKYLTRIPTIDLEKEFIGREEELDLLKSKLEDASKAVLLNGLGGVGKTVMAIAYVQQYGNKYDHLVWIDNGEDLVVSVALNKELAEELGIPLENDENFEERVHRILRKLHNLRGNNLMVIDNVQEQIQNQLYDQLPGSPNWKVLMTSRLSLDGFERFSLNTLDPEAGKILFLSNYNGDVDDKELERLLKEIEYHTLTVELLARLLDRLNNVINIGELTEILKQKQLDDPDLQEKIWTRYLGEERGIFLHLMKAFELTKLNHEELSILKQFVVLPIARYSVKVLSDFLRTKPLRLNKTLNNLAKSGWLLLHEDKTFSIHSLIRQVAAYQLSPGFTDVEVLVETMIEKMNADAFTNRIEVNVPWLIYATAVEAFLTKEMHLPIAKLQNNIAEVFHILGRYNEALELLKKSLTIYEAKIAPNSTVLAQTYNNIATTYHVLRQYQQALDYHHKNLAISEAILKPDDDFLAISYNNLAGTYRVMEAYEEALNYHKKALEIHEAVLDNKNPHLATSYNNLAVAYFNLVQYDKASLYFKKALAIREEVLEKQHPALANAYNNVGATYNALGAYEEALNYHLKAMAIYESTIKDKHPNLVAKYYESIVTTYLGLEEYFKALAYYKQIALIKEASPDTNPQDLRELYLSIADCYRTIEKGDKVKEYEAKAKSLE